MLRTRNLSQDTEDIYFYILQRFGKLIAVKIMKFLLGSRTYNIQLVGATGVGKSCFTERLSRNRFNQVYRPGPVEGTVVFPTNLGRIAFNISECRYTIEQPNLDDVVRDEWANMDAFFVMFSLGDIMSFNHCKGWVHDIRTIEGNLQRDLPIVLVGLQCEFEEHPFGGRFVPIKDIDDLRMMYNIPYVAISSRTLQNFHAPFLVLQNILRTSDRNLMAKIQPDIQETQLLLPPDQTDIQETQLLLPPDQTD